MKLNQTQEALSACEAGLAIDPNNEQLKSYLSTLVGSSSSQSSQQSSQSSQQSSQSNQGGLSGLLNNPALREV